MIVCRHGDHSLAPELREDLVYPLHVAGVELLVLRDDVRGEMFLQFVEGGLVVAHG